MLATRNSDSNSEVKITIILLISEIFPATALHGTKVCVKGAMAEDAIKYLSEYPIYGMQGYFFADAVPAEELEQKLIQGL